MIETQTDSILQEHNDVLVDTDVEATDCDVLIIGGGPAGLTAGIYTARAGLKTIIIEGDYVSPTEMPGGQLMLTPEIENYPGFFPSESTERSGMALIEIMRNQAEECGAEIVTDMVTHYSLETTPKVAHTESKGYKAKTIILATGAVAKRLGLEKEDLLLGRGVSTCATCDGAFFADQDVVVVGGGDTAVEDALYLANIASSVTLVHRRASLRSVSPAVRTLENHPKVNIVYNAEVTKIHGEDTVEGVTIVDTILGTESTYHSAAGFFVAIGHNPATKELKISDLENLVELNTGGFIITHDKSAYTSVPGIFAAGDVADETYRQAITAAGSGCVAALDVIRYLQEQDA